MHKFILFYALISSTLFVVMLYPRAPDHKKIRILLIDSGVNRSEEISPFLCSEGHLGFISGDENPFVDSTGHGTLMAHVMAETLDPAKHCIVIYKTFPGIYEGYGPIASEAYASALIRASDEDLGAVSISLSDASYYLAEAGWYKKLTKKTRVFVSAGNDGKNLSFKCDEYPACLASEIRSDNFRVVSSLNSRFNHGGPVNEIVEDKITISGVKHYGTSVSTARAAASYALKISFRDIQ